MATNAVDADRGGTGSGLPQPEMSGRRWMVSVFGDITRSGSWPPRRTTLPIALFGDIDLDFRQATVPSGEVVVNAVAPFGNIDVVVPAGSHVDVGGFALFGSKKVSVAERRLGRDGADDPRARLHPLRQHQSVEPVTEAATGARAELR